MKKMLLVLFLLFASQLRAQISFVTSYGGSISDPPNIESFPIIVSGLPDVLDTTYGLVKACFNIIHTYDSDLDIRLQSPDGTIIELSNNNGGSGDNYTGSCVAENAAGGEISSGIPPFSGNYFPDQSMNILNNGQNPNGTWYLIVVDEVPMDTGHLLNCTITFDTDPPPTHIGGPCSTTNAFGCNCADGSADCDLLPDMINSGQYLVSNWSEFPGHITEGVNTPNIGYGPMEVHGTGFCYCDTTLVDCGSICPDGEGPKQLVNQTIYHKSNELMTKYTVPAGTMTYHPDHGHIHIDNWTYNTLRVRGPGEDPSNWPVIGEGSKTSFCLINLGTCTAVNGYCVDDNGNIVDQALMPNGGLGIVSGCGQDQGIFVGKYDVYSQGLEGQEIDFGSICNGQYYIVSITNPNHVIYEMNYDNNWSITPVTLYNQSGNCCKANFYADTTYGIAPFEVQFADSSIPIASSWVWEFGDGDTSHLQFPQHVYTQGGTFTVKLTTQNSTLCSDVISRLDYITVDFGTATMQITDPGFSMLAYPNPFNNLTTIKYHLDAPANLNLTVVEVVGNVVKKFTADYMHSGDHEISFDAKKEGLPNGFYFVRAMVDEKLFFVKMVKVD
ncbi:MAG: PKD domain-containing protein [Chitinophagales bacterium]